MTTTTIKPPDKPFDLEVVPPGSKSHTIRALFISALAIGESTIIGGLVSDDTERARECLRQLGVQINDAGSVWKVVGSGGDLTASSEPLDVGESGLTARFLLSVAALVKGTTRIVGRGRLPERPMGGLLEALSDAGADVVDTYPWTLRGDARFNPGHVAIDGSTTSQGVSALLMIAPLADQTMTIEVIGRETSTGYVDMTLDMMRHFGADIEVSGNGWKVEPTGYIGTTVEIPVDASALVYPVAAAAITGGAVTVYGNPDRQPDLRFLDVIRDMGCQVTQVTGGIRVVGPTSLAGIECDMSMAPDAAVALSVLSAIADGPSRISGLGSLRHKESDRLGALQSELTKIGANLVISGDSLWISPSRSFEAHLLDSHNDHRLAMSFALLGLLNAGVSVQQSEAVSKTWPGYWEWLKTTGASVVVG
jgi:3-phosphoshikimate 1-carboxyvinyltransferase